MQSSKVVQPYRAHSCATDELDLETELLIQTFKIINVPRNDDFFSKNTTCRVTRV